MLLNRIFFLIFYCLRGMNSTLAKYDLLPTKMFLPPNHTPGRFVLKYETHK